MSDAIELELELPDVLELRMVQQPRELPADMGALIAGKPGAAGATQVVRQTVAGLSALVVVWENEAGEVLPLDFRDAAHIDLICGLTVTASAGPGDVTVQSAGPVDDGSWNWTPGRVYLGANGALTQVPPADGFDVLIGVAVSATRLLLNFQDPIELE